MIIFIIIQLVSLDIKVSKLTYRHPQTSSPPSLPSPKQISTEVHLCSPSQFSHHTQTSSNLPPPYFLLAILAVGVNTGNSSDHQPQSPYNPSLSHYNFLLPLALKTKSNSPEIRERTYIGGTHRCRPKSLRRSSRPLLFRISVSFVQFSIFYSRIIVQGIANATTVDVDDAWNLVGCLDTHLKKIVFILY
ncbi:hypothetical protein HanXRQr2_Chr06g0275311 [Helianthus annuus]|uniref:Uncharacterized protein n=1 Tax=Helianthus annuus TaxID=4232 RepID=A0A9K3NL75_HELAN|nr:hypothetical protein HanXRQr2_Chr06g0275311 [Helianthus annuus]